MQLLISLFIGGLATAHAAGVDRPQPVKNLGGKVRAPIDPQLGSIGLTPTATRGIGRLPVTDTGLPQPVKNLGQAVSAVEAAQVPPAAVAAQNLEAVTAVPDTTSESPDADDVRQDERKGSLQGPRKSFEKVAGSSEVRRIRRKSSDWDEAVKGLDKLYDLRGGLTGGVQEPEPVLAAELDAQSQALQQWGRSPRKTKVIVSSFSIDPKVVGGFVPDPKPYETRDLARILEAEDPNLHIVYVVAGHLDRAVIDHVLRGRADARAILSRVDFVKLGDEGLEPLAQKLLKPVHADKLDRIRRLVQKRDAPAALLTYMSGPLEWKVAQALGLPLYGFHPVRTPDSGKSGNRRIFRTMGLPIPYGFEDVYSEEDLVRNIELIWREKRDAVKSIVINLNYGASGLGLARLKLPAWKRSQNARRQAVREALPSMIFPADKNWGSFLGLIEEQGAVVEEYLESFERVTFSPSGQGEILPDKSVRVWSTHRQRLHGLEYAGALFPADASVRREVVKMTRAVGVQLAELGIFGPFSVDFLAVPRKTPRGLRYKLYALEINVRWSATDHPRLAAQRITGARYNAREATLRYPDTNKLVYYNTAHKEAPGLKGIRLKDFLRFFEGQGVLFDPTTGEGVQFYFPDGITSWGKIGYVAIGRSRTRADQIERRLLGLIDQLERRHR